MKITKETILKITNFINSKDPETSNLGFKLLSNINSKKNIGEILLIVSEINIDKFVAIKGYSKLRSENCNIKDFEKSITKNRKYLFDLICETNDLTSGKLFTYMLNNEASQNSLNIFLDLFKNKFDNLLNMCDFKPKQFEISIKINNNYV